MKFLKNIFRKENNAFKGTIYPKDKNSCFYKREKKLNSIFFLIFLQKNLDKYSNLCYNFAKKLKEEKKWV